MKKSNLLRIFLASPGDVKPEREMIFALKEHLDIIIGKSNNIKFDIINWEKNTYPGIGLDAQDVINNQIDGEYDIFIGIFWQRFGTPTSRYESGTAEEFEIAKLKYKDNKQNTHIMMYFKTQEVDMYKVDIEQFQKVKIFRDQIATDDGVFYATFEKTDDLKNLLQINLSNLIADKFNKKKKASMKELVTSNKLPVKLDKYELLAKKIDENDRNLEMENLVEEIEATGSFLADLANCTKRITLSMSFFSEKTKEKTTQFNRLKNIKDEKFKLNKAKKISNEYSLDLDKFSHDFETILPEFREAIDNSVKSYTEIILKTLNSSVIELKEKEDLLSHLPPFITSVEGAIEGTATFLETFTNMNTHLTLKLSTAKRRAELASNNIFKELLRTKKLLQQLVDDNPI